MSFLRNSLSPTDFEYKKKVIYHGNLNDEIEFFFWQNQTRKSFYVNKEFHLENILKLPIVLCLIIFETETANVFQFFWNAN